MLISPLLPKRLIASLPFLSQSDKNHTQRTYFVQKQTLQLPFITVIKIALR
jgi:hypothetical protein